MFDLIALNKIFSLLIQYKYLVLFPAIVIEGPIVTVIAGFLSSLGYFNLLALYIVAATGDLAGDTIYYALGRWGGRGFINKWGKYLKINLENVTRLEKIFREHGGKTLMAGKITHLIGAPILAAAGAAKMSYKKFLLFNTAATLPKSLVLVLIGYYFGKEYMHINKILDYITFATLLLITVILFIFRKRILSFFYEDINS